MQKAVGALEVSRARLKQNVKATNFPKSGCEDRWPNKEGELKQQVAGSGPGTVFPALGTSSPFPSTAPTAGPKNSSIGQLAKSLPLASGGAPSMQSGKPRFSQGRPSCTHSFYPEGTTLASVPVAVSYGCPVLPTALDGRLLEGRPLRCPSSITFPLFLPPASQKFLRKKPAPFLPRRDSALWP